MPQQTSQQIHSPQRLKEILIVGGGTAGWMTAAAFAKVLIPAGYSVKLVESDTLGTVGVGEATIPTIKAFNALLGFDEFDFLQRTMGTYKLGIEFIDWGRKDSAYMHPFGAVGVPQGPLAFYHYWLKAHLQGKATDFGDYCLSVVAARQNKFMPPVNQAGTSLHQINYAYHFDASLYAKYLREFAEQKGVQRIEGLIDQVNIGASNGYIESVSLRSGATIAADFFIDCSGFSALLIEQALNTGYEDWSNYLLCDSALAVQSHNTQAPRPYTRSTAHSAGWQWEIPLQHRIGNGHVYCSRYMDDASAKKILLNNIQGELVSEPRLIRFKTGMRKKAWNKNCVAVGLSSGFLEPLESTSIYLIQSAIAKLINIFPAGDFQQADIDQYNDMMRDDYQFTRDFIILHYKASQRTDSAFWRYCKDMEVPASLQQKLDIYRQNGRAFLKPNDIFREESWVSVLLGQGVVPRDYHPLVDALSDEQLMQLISSVRHTNAQSAALMPTHADFIARFCQVPSVAAAAAAVV